MKALSSLVLTLCYVTVGVCMLSVIAPQKRTRRIYSFVLGLFLLLSVIRGVGAFISSADISLELNEYRLPESAESDYIDAVAHQTADNIVQILDELLRDEGIIPDDIRVSLRISDEGRIYVDRADIYISNDYLSRKEDIKNIIYRNISKEPYVYVKGEAQ